MNFESVPNLTRHIIVNSVSSTYDKFFSQFPTNLEEVLEHIKVCILRVIYFLFFASLHSCHESLRNLSIKIHLFYSLFVSLKLRITYCGAGIFYFCITTNNVSNSSNYFIKNSV